MELPVDLRPVSFHPQEGNLLGDQTEHENNNGCRQHKYRHIREAPLREIGIEIIATPGEKEKNTDGQKHAKRRE
jgi:hypothetical protein